MIDPNLVLYGGAALLIAGIVLTVIGRVLKLAGTVLVVAVVLIIVGGGLGVYSLQDIQRQAANVTVPHNLSALNLTMPTAPPNLDPGLEWSCALNTSEGVSCSAVASVGGGK